ncbi:MAG: stage II sporulation protein P [Clostridiales bacterium]|jgi:stage II sporulation protein P|nr:stage II sporulation protein P [Clostridiales bacterium]
MKRIAFSLMALIIVFTVIVTFHPSMSVVTRSLLEFYENIEMGEISREDIAAERYWTMVDEDGQEITVTGRKIHVGDEYLTSDNKLYRVFRVEGRTAYARFIREVGAIFEEDSPGILVGLRERFTSGVRTVQQQNENGDEAEEEDEVEDEENEAEDEAEDEDEQELEPEEEPQRLIGIYHTHNAESYVPTDGTDSIFGEGGIHSVGGSFTAALEQKGINVVHDETLHLPHDRGAYRRSRVTAEQLLEQGPDVIFDIHRDATPPQVYATQIEDEPVTQIQFVVGRQNPNMRVTRQFALDLKQTADQIHPGLVKGIFMARGGYNQDLTPMNLLLEVGAHTNSREAAEGGAAFFADVVSFYFYGPEDEEGKIAAPSPETPGQGPGRGPGGLTQVGEQAARANIFWILGVTAFIIVGFLLLNAITWEEIKIALAPWLEKVRHFSRQGDRLLEPYQAKIFEATPALREGLFKIDVVLAPILEKIREATMAMASTASRGDRYLEPVQEKIREVSLIVYNTLREGDRYLEPLQEKIRETSHMSYDRLYEADRALDPVQEKIRETFQTGFDKLYEADRALEPLQEKIRETALMIKERIMELYLSISDRRRLK